MKTKLVLASHLTNLPVSRLFQALSDGYIIETKDNCLLECSGYTKDILTVNGLEAPSLDFNRIARLGYKVYERKELPWYECMEVGQTVLCTSKSSDRKRMFALTRDSNISWYIRDCVLNNSSLPTVPECEPLTLEEVSKFAFDNVCN